MERQLLWSKRQTHWEKLGVFCVIFFITLWCRLQLTERQLAANSTAWLLRVNKNLWVWLNPVWQANKVKQSPLSTETSHRRCVYSPSESQTRHSLEIRSCVSSWEFSGWNQKSVGGQREKVEERQQEAAGGGRRRPVGGWLKQTVIRAVQVLGSVHTHNKQLLSSQVWDSRQATEGNQLPMWHHSSIYGLFKKQKWNPSPEKFLLI